MDVRPLEAAYAAFFDMAASGPFNAPVNPEKWTAELIVAHIAAIDYLLAASISELLAGRTPDHTNRPAIRVPHLRAIVAAAADWPGLIATVRQSSAVVCALAGEVDAVTVVKPFPVLLQSGETVVFDGPISLDLLLQGQAEMHLPGHSGQLRALKS